MKESLEMRVLPALAAGAVVLGFTAPAAFAAHQKVHTFKIPPVTGIAVSGSYSSAGGKADITLCVRETASDVDFAIAIATAVNATVTKHQDIEIEIIGSGQQQCKSLETSDSAHLYVTAASGTTDGKSHTGKLIRIY
jgi:predicted secreted Zn-dependent protease